MSLNLKEPINAYLFDFDGVIVESAKIRIDGFRMVFRDQPKELVDKLIEYHVANGGISRYEKIRWFYGMLLCQPYPKSEGSKRAAEFKEMLERMMDPGLIIDETLRFIQSQYGRVAIHIVSGSDGAELRQICDSIGITSLFDSIQGSPTPKDILVKELMSEYRYKPESTVFIGDAVNDMNAAKASGLYFCGYNNDNLRSLSDTYIDSFLDLDLDIHICS